MAGRFRPRRRGLVALSAAAGLLVVGWLATTPWLVGHWPRVLAVMLFLFVFVVPRWFVPARSAASLAGVEDPAARGRLEDDRLKLQNDVRIGLLQAVAGVAVIAAVVVTWQQLETDRRQLRQRRGHHVAVAGVRALGLDPRLDLVVAGQQRVGLVLPEQTRELRADAGVPVDQRPVAVEGRPALHSVLE